MIVLAIIYPCNFGCPMCPYTDANSEIRRSYKERGGELFPVPLWNRIADECGAYGAWLRCTGGGEPMLHPRMVEMVEYAKGRGARVWLNTNGSMFGPTPALRMRLERLIIAGIDLIEFSMDAADPDTYARLRPPRRGMPRDPEAWFTDHVDNIRAALELRRRHRAATRVVVSIIRQKAIEGRLEDAVRFYADQVGVDEVITRKFLTWDDNTRIPVGQALDRHLYEAAPPERHEPCVWPFERLNVDTLGRIALCGQDISFRTASLFPNANDTSIKEIWQGETFNWYRRRHLEGLGAACSPCRGCSAWLAGIRDWDHGWLRVLQTSGERLREVRRRDRAIDRAPVPPDPWAPR
jgi:MoaA/NifB/PqqE/SkfB family radical SAM enzyme